MQLFYRSVHQSNPFNDSERQADTLQPSVVNDASVAVVDEEPAHHRSVGHKLKPPARPSSVVIRSNAPIYRRVDARRTLSFTPHDISTLKLLSSTNLNLDQLLPVSMLSMIHPNGSIANGGSTAHLHVQTLPHPAKKSVLHDTIARERRLRRMREDEQGRRNGDRFGRLETAMERRAPVREHQHRLRRKRVRRDRGNSTGADRAASGTT